jgi:hypothetical protein
MWVIFFHASCFYFLHKTNIFLQPNLRLSTLQAAQLLHTTLVQHAQAFPRVNVKIKVGQKT